MTSLLFEVSPVDPLTYGAVALAGRGNRASPTFRLSATGVDPAVALRAE